LIFATARALNSRLRHLGIMLGLLVGLAGCTTSPVAVPPVLVAPLAALPKPLAVIAESLPSLSAQPAPLIVGPELAGSPLDAPRPVDLSLSNEPRPALLDGEAAREFERGGASWYGPGFHGRRTASGERYDMNAFTAAHRTLPFGTLVRVHSLVNGREVDVRITDRGPFSRSRVIDVSRAAAEELGMLGSGFKEVVLLVPESTQPVAESWPMPVKKHRHTVVRRRLPSKSR
jgi:rare lipoprotein A